MVTFIISESIAICSSTCIYKEKEVPKDPDEVIGLVINIAASPSMLMTGRKVAFIVVASKTYVAAYIC